MKINSLIKNNLTYYWRTNLAVIFGVATAVAVLAGALLVGDSVRASLKDLFLSRLGNTDYLISSTTFLEKNSPTICKAMSTLPLLSKTLARSSRSTDL